MVALVPLERLHDCARRLAGRAEAVEITEMPGGGSSRRFFRIVLDRGRTAVGMYVPDASRSDEIVKSSEAGRRWPFLEVRDLLDERGIRVPRVLAEACEDGFIIVEDLGDDTLANYLLRKPEARTTLYQSAVCDLAFAQRALSSLPETSIVAGRALDEDLLRWEVEHFREWGLEARGIHLNDADRRLFDDTADYIARLVASWPRGFVHRDYQSRNLMVRESSDGQPQLVWIDFQDALLGPRVYDVVALLNDSYQVFEPGFIEARIGEYADALGTSDDHATIRREFDIVTVQRKLKDAGRFVYFDRVNKNPHFLRFVDSTIEKAKLALHRLGEDRQFRAFGALLERVLAR